MPLSFVPTPLGNLRDITLRALDTLRDADLIVAEDTRVARRLLSAHALTARELLTYNEYTGEASVDAIIERALIQNVAAVSDAGMPGVNDPGTALLARARARGVLIVLLPGPSAVMSAAVLSGFPVAGMSFEGFVPRADGQRESAFGAVLARRAVSVWFETPHRILATLNKLEALAPELPTFVVREYTKHYEQQILGTPATVRAALKEPVRGEFVLVLDAREYASGIAAAGDVDARIDALLAEHRPPTTIAKLLATQGLGERRELYRRAIERGKALIDEEGGA